MSNFFLILLLVITQTVSAFQCLPKEAKFDIGFSPNKGSLDIVLKGIKTAQKQILVAAYTFTSKPIALALIDAKKRGINVFIVIDKNTSNKSKYSVAQFLSNGGIQVRLNGNYQIHHNKFMIIDNKHLELGSFNYSNAANHKNAENVLLLWNVIPIAKIYSNEWKKLWNESHILNKNY